MSRFVLPIAWVLGSLIGLGSALWAPVHATPAAPTPITLQVTMGTLQQPLEVVALGSWFSQEGETKVTFLKRVGQALETYAQKTEFEACGVVWKAGSPDAPRYAVPLISAQAHARCPLVPGLSPPESGFTATPESIHVHPKDGRYRINAADRLLDPAARRKPPYAWGKRHGSRGFSAEDAATGPGYLVANGHLLYRDNAGMVDHGSLVPPPRRRARP